MNAPTSPQRKQPRRAYRRREVSELYGASLRVVDEAIRKGEIRTKRYGNAVFLSVEDTDRLFCPDVPVEIRREDVADLRGVLR